MPLRSITRIDFDPGGLNLRLLDYDDVIEDHIEYGTEQQSTGFAGAGALWGAAVAEGGARRTLSFARWVDHSSLEEKYQHLLMQDALLPWGKTATLRVSIQDGVTVDYADSVMHGDAGRPKETSRFTTVTSFKLSCGKMTLVDGLPFVPGLIWDWILPNWEDLDTHNWEDM